MVSARTVDFRKGAEGLAVLAREGMKSEPFSEAVDAFRASADRVMLVIGTEPAPTWLIEGDISTGATFLRC
jgi:hypothetical protein